MKKYEKPVVLINEELAEGVYAASGCWHLDAKDITQFPCDGQIYYVVHLHFWHDDIAHKPSTYLTINFDQNVKIVEKLCSYKRVDGTNNFTNTITLERTQNINAGKEQWGFSDLYIETETAGTAPSITGYNIYDGGEF